MTKVGDGGSVPQQGPQAYQKDLQNNIARFQNALDSYQIASNNDEKSRLESIMTQTMDLIQSDIREIKRSGLAKQGETVGGDYERYRGSTTSDNLTALQQDLSTLKEYSQLPQ